MSVLSTALRGESLNSRLGCAPVQWVGFLKQLLGQIEFSPVFWGFLGAEKFPKLQIEVSWENHGRNRDFPGSHDRIEYVVAGSHRTEGKVCVSVVVDIPSLPSTSVLGSKEYLLGYFFPAWELWQRLCVTRVWCACDGFSSGRFPRGAPKYFKDRSFCGLHECLQRWLKAVGTHYGHPD